MGLNPDLIAPTLTSVAEAEGITVEAAPVRSAGTNGTGTSPDLADLPVGDLPLSIKRRLEQGADRSKLHQALVMECVRHDLPLERTKEILRHYEPAKEKYGDRLDAETERSYTNAKAKLAADRGADVDRGDNPDESAPSMRERFLTVAALRTLPPPRSLIADVCDLDSLVLTYGPRGNYKSFLAVDFGACVATGVRWQGRDVTPGGVLYIAAEGVGGLAQRFDAWELERLTNIGDRFHVLPEPVNLLAPDRVGQLVEAVRDLDVSLVMFDTLARCMVGGDENSAKDTGIAVEQLDVVRRRTGACVMAFHHAGKNLDAGARGSSAFEAAADTVLQVVADGELVTLTTTKQKNHAAGNPIRLRAQASAGSIVLVEGRSQAGDDLPSAVLDTLRALVEIELPEGVSSTAWEVSSPCSKATYYRHRGGLLKHGLVSNVGTDKMPRYQATEAGRLMVSPESQEVS